MLETYQTAIEFLQSYRTINAEVNQVTLVHYRHTIKNRLKIVKGIKSHDKGGQLIFSERERSETIR